MAERENMTCPNSRNESSIKLRALEPADTDCIYTWENIGDMWQYGYSPAPLSRHQIWEYIRTYDANPLTAGQLRLMIVTNDGTRVGAVDLYDIDIQNRRGYVGIMIAPEYRRHGYAKAALEALKDYCTNGLGLHQLAAEVATDNFPSISLFKSAGYIQIATLPQWIRRGNGFIDTKLFIGPID